MIIGLSGVARAGKDTVGQILVEHHGYERRSFADKLRAVALGADPYVSMAGGDGGYSAHERLSEVVAAFGWEGAKEYPDVRRFLQRLGTEGVRHNLGMDTWVTAAMADLSWTNMDGRVRVADHVFTDVRFDNEAAAIRALSGEVWKIERPGFGPVNDHASDAGIGLVDRVLVNRGTLAELREHVAIQLNSLETGRVSPKSGSDTAYVAREGISDAGTEARRRHSEAVHPADMLRVDL